MHFLKTMSHGHMVMNPFQNLIWKAPLPKPLKLGCLNFEICFPHEYILNTKQCQNCMFGLKGMAMLICAWQIGGFCIISSIDCNSIFTLFCYGELHILQAVARKVEIFSCCPYNMIFARAKSKFRRYNKVEEKLHPLTLNISMSFFHSKISFNWGTFFPLKYPRGLAR